MQIRVRILCVYLAIYHTVKTPHLIKNCVKDNYFATSRMQIRQIRIVEIIKNMPTKFA